MGSSVPDPEMNQDEIDDGLPSGSPGSIGRMVPPSVEQHDDILSSVGGGLIDDRELKDQDQDRFRHGDVADLISEIAITAQTPAAIALYGPWGSGKTGVGNLIKKRLRHPDVTKQKKTEYFRFDAFQYSSETPLRRAFLLNLASEYCSPRSTEQYKQKLYASETSNIFDPTNLWRSVGKYMALIAAILGVVTLIDAGFGNIGPTSFWQALTDSGSRVIAPAVAPAVFIAGLIAFLNNQLTVTRTTIPPTTDDKFESLFEKLVEDILQEKSAETLVVFVDELDRCSSNRVVDVLDTVRTFLDVKDTVFIIAADRQVLEQALSESVSQSTPSDLTNPYYSSGSEYLDKVFHYQVSLVPLLPQRVTTYAIDLAKAQLGVWADPEVRRLLPEIMSVLVPSHVRSPRRVKTLLNNYITAYHLAKLREHAGQLDNGPGARLLELAKLVCLRTEFPAFGRDLALSEHLPEYFRLIADGQERPKHVPETVWFVAESYFAEIQSVETMLDDGSLASDRLPRPDTPEASDHEVAITTTRAAIKRQLDHYLQKTSRIQNPRRDLIFLEQLGHTYGLSSDLAVSLEQLAVENRVEDVRQIVLDNLEDQESIIRFLAGLAAQSFPGVEGDNVVATLLAASDVANVDAVRATANRAVSAIAAHRQRSEFPKDQLPGLLSLALAADGSDASDLVDTVLRHDAATGTGEVGIAVISNLDRLPEPGSADIAGIAASLLFDSMWSEALALELVKQRPGAVQRMYSALVPVAVERLDSIADEGDSEVSDAYRSALQVSWDSDSVVVREGLLRVWLGSDREAVEPGVVLEYVQGNQLETSEAIKSLLDQSLTSDVDELAAWVLLLNPEHVGLNFEREVSRLVSSLWDRRDGIPDDDLDALLTHVRSLMVSTGAPQGTFDKSGSVNFGSYGELKGREAYWNDMSRFQAAETHASGGDLIANELTTAFLLPASVAQQPQATEYSAVLVEWARRVVVEASQTSRMELVGAVHDSAWFIGQRRFRLCVELSVLAASLASQGDYLWFRQLHGRDEMAIQTDAEPDAMRTTVAAWIKAFDPDPEELYALVKPYLVEATYRKAPELGEAVKEASNNLSDKQRLRLAKVEIMAQRATSFGLLEDISFETVDQLGASRVIVEVFKAGTNLRERRGAVDLWKALNPSDATVRRRLINEVLIAGLQGHAAMGWLDLLVTNQYLRIWEDPPRGTKDAIKSAMAPMAFGARRRPVQQALKRNGINTSGFGKLVDRFRKL